MGCSYNCNKPLKSGIYNVFDKNTYFSINVPALIIAMKNLRSLKIPQYFCIYQTASSLDSVDFGGEDGVIKDKVSLWAARPTLPKSIGKPFKSFEKRQRNEFQTKSIMYIKNYSFRAVEKKIARTHIKFKGYKVGGM